MAIDKAVEAEVAAQADKPDAFREQLRSFREFQQRMRESGINPNDRYDIPLMHRLDGRYLKGNKNA